MRPLPILLALLATPVAGSAAQNAPPPPMYRVVEWRTAPSDAARFREGMADLAKLSQDVKSPIGFLVFSSENRTVVSREAKSDDLLGNPLRHIQDARSTDLQKWIAARPAAVQLRNEIWVAVPEWSYEPANPPAYTGVSSSSVQVASGATAAFDSARKDFVKLRQKLAYPYPVRAYRVVLGEPRIVFVTSFDSREAFFGRNAFNSLVEKAGAQADWQALQSRLGAAMGMEWDSKLWNFNQTASYLPQ